VGATLHAATPASLSPPSLHQDLRLELSEPSQLPALTALPGLDMLRLRYARYSTSQYARADRLTAPGVGSMSWIRRAVILRRVRQPCAAAGC
jgi:hypothetical protein